LINILFIVCDSLAWPRVARRGGAWCGGLSGDRAAAVKRQNNGNVPDTGMILCTHAASSGQQNRTSGYPNRYDEWVFATGCQNGRPEQTSPA
jgi:hypothetical protein